MTLAALTDISLNWVLAGTVMLVGFLAAVVLLARGRKRDDRDEAAGQNDSWEKAEERRRRKETIYATASYLLLFCCAGVAAALSFHGLVGFGRQNLNLSGGWEYLVPFGLDGAAMFCAVIAVREASHGDASLGSRILVWMFAGAAAWFNWVHAPRGEDHAGAPHFFAGMSLSAAILFDRALKQTRKSALREQGLVPRPLPQIRAVRWIRAPRETFRAWSLMLLEGVRTLDEAVDEVREDRQRKQEERARAREQRKLERARMKALDRQHRMWRRGDNRRVEVEITPGQAATAKVGPPTLDAGEVEPGRLPVRNRPALEAGPDETVGSRARHEVGGKADEHPDDGGQAGPRLDSLEEKLAAIERQFG
ncbi:DUF2637 domain-containing protein [Streptomyces alkaliterrae]|uniref:DUF2637 domain-containing protein n=1 Tax=Streptomyces alkaliterrae TaxID=2213162 RepID=A0A5P0YRF0_9ACTN|nr:DUF2637 domain-containing protein [Streptomyces alkaliterrae]MBB1258753.1 DUF2637 domain-containing protein [Streptomyces alkaliterrae]MQS02893.1 DUF2637 domain-containing protein [Streptomyces alkaliterrae]